MIDLEHLKQKLDFLNQRKNWAVELFHQLSGSINTVDELIKTLEEQQKKKSEVIEPDQQLNQ